MADNVKKRVAALRVDIGLFVYDAAFVPIGPFAEATEDQLSAAAAVNVRAPMLLTKLFSGPMIQRGRGGIVLMSSLAAHRSAGRNPAYESSKAAQIARYVASGEPRGKAGAYAIQGQAAMHVTGIHGSYSGIMGLPMHETAVLLRRVGLLP